MTHDEYRELLQRESDDDLSPEELSLLESHVESCAACRLEREEYRSLFLGLSKLSHLMPERSFVPELELEIKRAVEQANPTRQTPRLVPAARWRGLSVAAVAVLAIGLSVYWPFSHHDGTTGSGNQVALQPADTGVNPSADNAKKVQTYGASPNSAEPKQSDDVTHNSTDPVAKQQDAASPNSAPAPQTPDASKQLALAPHTSPSQGDVIKQGAPNTSTAGTSQDFGSIKDAASANTEEKSSTSPVATTRPHGVADGTNQGITGNSGDGGKVTALSIPRVGPAPALPALNDALQKAAASGDRSSQWALSASQVVEQNLVPLGFSATASVSPMNQTDRVHVVQRGITYEVRLDQPFQSGPHGIWRPTLIGRVLDQGSPDLAEHSILAYFQKGGALQGDILITGAYAGNSLPITVDLLENGTVKTHHYLAQVKQDADGFYVLDGNPVER